MIPLPSAPGNHRFFCEIMNRLPVVNDHFGPGPSTHLRKVDTAKTKARNQYGCAPSYWLVSDRIYKIFRADFYSDSD